MKPKRISAMAPVGLVCLAGLMGVLAGPAQGAAEPLMKVQITDTNNYQSGYVSHPDELKTQDDDALVGYVFERVQFQGKQDPELFIEVMDWVASQWQHDGMNQPPAGMSSLEILKKVHQDGEQYRCVEYGQVMADILAAMGHHTRSIGLQTVDVAYGGVGLGHVATEAWSNSLGKWVFFDPQFSIYAQHDGELLNIHEIFLLKQAGQFEDIELVVTPRFAAANNFQPEQLEEYRDFLGRYLGYHISRRYLHGEEQSVVLMMEAQLPAITFQGMGTEHKRLFTRSSEVAYPQINRTQVAMTALPNAEAEGNFMGLIEKLKITTNEQYLENMSHFAAIGQVSMRFLSSMDSFSHYQVRENGQRWRTVEGQEYLWHLAEGANRFEVRSVSDAKVTGPITFVEIQYGP